MKLFPPVVIGVVFATSFGAGVRAQTQASTATPAQTQAATQSAPPTTQGQTQTPPAKPQDPTFKETVVVSASKTEQRLVDAPATMTVIGPKELNVAPSNNYAELLRSVPGLNITQISARDVNVNSRSASGSLSTGQLAVVDGRSIYQDFFGFTMWDFMPANLDEIKQIEVIRGAASAVWGANAMNGVINVITKSPREMVGTTLTFGGGVLDREVNKDQAASGSLFYVRGTNAGVINERWSYKVSAGIYDSDALARPTGEIPNGTGTKYPTYANQGTQQPKFDARFDYDFADPSKKLQFAGGIGGTDGIMHTGIGPFRIEQGTTLAYWKTTYTKNALRLQAFMNMLDGRAPNLLSVDPAGQPIVFTFKTNTFDLEFGDSRVLGKKNVLTYGGNLRYNQFDLTIAPPKDSRTEGGAYIQDEFLAGDRMRFVLGARVDKFSSIHNAVFSPRAAVVYKATASQSIRASYNRAFRAPSMINNNLNTAIGTPLPLSQINPGYGSAIYIVPTAAVGNKDLTEESTDSFEISYTGNLNERVTLSSAWFYTIYRDGIYFTPTAFWTTAPPGFPGLGPFTGAQVWAGVVASGKKVPSNYTYLNLGEVKNKGLELGINGVLTKTVTGFATYTYQAQPIPTFEGLTAAQALAEINLPSTHQWSFGLSATTDRYYGTFSMNRASRAFWQDVLDARYAGYTPAYTSVNVTVGAKWKDGRYSAALKITDLMNQQIQQHIFGDIVKQMAVVEFKMQLK